MSKKRSKVACVGLYEISSDNSLIYALSQRHAWWLVNNKLRSSFNPDVVRAVPAFCIQAVLIPLKGIVVHDVVPLDPPVSYKVARKLCHDLNAAKGF